MKTTAKFNIGDKVIVKSDVNRETHEVLGFSYDGENFVYKISSKEIDIAAKEIINGVSFHQEVELEIKKQK